MCDSSCYDRMDVDKAADIFRFFVNASDSRL